MGSAANRLNDLEAIAREEVRVSSGSVEAWRTAGVTIGTLEHAPFDAAAKVAVYGLVCKVIRNGEEAGQSAQAILGRVFKHALRESRKRTRESTCTLSNHASTCTRHCWSEVVDHLIGVGMLMPDVYSYIEGLADEPRDQPKPGPAKPPSRKLSSIQRTLLKRLEFNGFLTCPAGMRGRSTCEALVRKGYARWDPEDPDNDTLILPEETEE